MLSTLARAAIVSSIEKGTGVPPAGSLSTVLLTTGAALATMRGRRSVGVVLLAVGGVIRWRETVRPARGDRPAPVPRPAFAATAPR